MHGGDGDLAGLVCGAALDGGGDDFACRLVSLRANPLLRLAQDLGLVANGLGTHPVQQLLVRILPREVGDALELRGLLVEELVHLALALVQLPLETRELVLLAVERVVPAVERLLALHDPVL